MSALKQYVEIQTLKQMSYEEINDFINKLHAENKTLKAAGEALFERMDRHMGDTDPSDPEDPDLRACREWRLLNALHQYSQGGSDNS